MEQRATRISGRLSPTKDHYWPISLSNFWKGIEGKTHRLSWDGTSHSTDPKKFGKVNRYHQIRDCGPWDMTIEPLFQRADDNIRVVVEYLQKLEPVSDIENLTASKRFLGHDMDVSTRAKLGEILASLIVRSPAFRNIRKITATYFRQGLLYRDNIDEQNLVVANMGRDYLRIVQSLKIGGKITILFSGKNEFIFGDGFLNNIEADINYNQKLLIPLTPNMSVALRQPISYFLSPNTVAVRLTAEEVDRCNEIVQIYTKNYVYYRSVRPNVIPAFEERRFLQLEYHNHPWLDNLLDETSRFRG